MSPKRIFIIFLTVVVGLILLMVLLFGGGSDNKQETTQESSKPKPETAVVLSDYAERDSSMVFTNQGRIISNELYREIRITVRPDGKKIEAIQGYDGNVFKSQDFDNNTTAYQTFVRALDRAGFATTRKAGNPDERGFCPQGQRYIYQVFEGETQKQRTWAGSCGTNGRTSAARSSLVISLFQAQIPEYSRFVQGVQL